MAMWLYIAPSVPAIIAGGVVLCVCEAAVIKVLQDIEERYYLGNWRTFFLQVFIFLMYSIFLGTAVGAGILVMFQFINLTC